MLENVQNFERSDSCGKLLEVLAARGFHWRSFLLSPRQFGFPNARQRLYLVAKRAELPFRFVPERRSESGIRASAGAGWGRCDRRGRPRKGRRGKQGEVRLVRMGLGRVLGVAQGDVVAAVLIVRPTGRPTVRPPDPAINGLPSRPPDRRQHDRGRAVSNLGSDARVSSSVPRGGLRESLGSGPTGDGLSPRKVGVGEGRRLGRRWRVARQRRRASAAVRAVAVRAVPGRSGGGRRGRAGGGGVGGQRRACHRRLRRPRRRRRAHRGWVWPGG